MNKLLILFGAVILISCNNNKNPQIIINTSLGNIEAELFPAKAPKSVAAFLSYVDSGLYKNSSFYRVLLEETMSDNNTGLIQGGIWQTNGKKMSELHGIEHESPKQTGLSHTSGTLSLARLNPGTASSEFFICIGDQTAYDSGSTSGQSDGLGYAAFGRVISGMEIVREIQNQSANGQSFNKPIVIYNIKRLK
jgi:peptidyl-prolyl cis-trans isomerase A (cyclophilin A)